MRHFVPGTVNCDAVLCWRVPFHLEMMMIMIVIIIIMIIAIIIIIL